ncbi:MAG: 4-hydroxythreonine-4-phosphate dehydrogenase PdxA [Bacteroidetes bacterium GWF2_42_66]|nr:MAG: 4-hydroxythreonine-4-phosphate dehydrogenase PdxA [Bacteroidetes bacterium GWE2_42_39]OFY40628.1 MAG: 4-hydroxythreonine-4-phosphate dehydrogenase PdxA [Bacteroidetes bacterium GWF2_42_66]HBL76576.1 4-hydroxythreonine-4-phosphate dehydrogenase PdxA [Prolixibacteraceae bacterium]HCU61269.1 4-hydroxythreonine-4-phosphate dehydrogenase PdxA [Prolixibacteraceae bacterium]
MKHDKIKIGITQGDINGIGYEVIIKTLMEPRILEMCTPIVYGSPKVAAYHRKALELESFTFNGIRTAKEADPKKANIINCTDDNIRVELGRSSEMAGEASYMALEKAVEDLRLGEIDALITAPINKDNIQSDKFHFPGHTEFLAEQFNVKDYVMLMVSEVMKIGVVVGHAPLSEVSQRITVDSILRKLRIISSSLEKDFSIKKPRIAVLALNPHAGDGGLLGHEEKDIIMPAIEKAKQEGILAIGPYPADGFFGSGDYTKFDAILAMYHDQGMIPFKLASFEKGVNYTAGLPVIRTSPAHGTAYDIAGEDKASPDSFRQALYLACDISKNREIYAEISKNPLRKYEINPSQVDEVIDLQAEEEDIL